MSSGNTEQNPPSVRAVCMMSGGLDSQLAVCVLKEQGIGIEGLVFESPFFGSGAARKAADRLGIPLHVRDFTTDIVFILKDPPHGFGSNMNPCIDCHASMVRRAGELMRELGAQFVATGEVLNERPMSQNRRSLDIVASDSGVGDFLVRPLSGRLLPATEPEKRGWLKRDKLLAIEGRGRDPQIRLARHYGLTSYPTPAGGCLLTDPGFSERMKEMRDREGFDDVRSLKLLRVGRHFRLPSGVKFVIGRNEKENGILEAANQADDALLQAVDVPGPTGLVLGRADESEIRLAGAICARYSDSLRDKPANVEVATAGGKIYVEIMPATDDETERFRV